MIIRTVEYDLLQYGSVFGKRDLLAIFHIMKYDLIAEKLPFQMLQTILKYS